MSARTAEPVNHKPRDFLFKGILTSQYIIIYYIGNAHMILKYLIRELEKERGMNEIRR